MRHVVSLLRWWVACFLLWLLYAGTLDGVEVLAGVIAAAVGATMVEVVHSQGVLGFALPGRKLHRAAGVPADLVRETGIVLVALGRALLHGERRPGRFRTVPYDAGPKTTPTGAGWRAFTTVAGTIAPNSIVVDIDPERQLALVHDLVPGRARREPL